MGLVKVDQCPILYRMSSYELDVKKYRHPSSSLLFKLWNFALTDLSSLIFRIPSLMDSKLDPIAAKLSSF